jgi:hypothetical protein
LTDDPFDFIDYCLNLSLSLSSACRPMGYLVVRHNLSQCNYDFANLSPSKSIEKQRSKQTRLFNFVGARKNMFAKIAIDSPKSLSPLTSGPPPLCCSPPNTLKLINNKRTKTSFLIKFCASFCRPDRTGLPADQVKLTVTLERSGISLHSFSPFNRLGIEPTMPVQCSPSTNYKLIARFQSPQDLPIDTCIERRSNAKSTVTRTAATSAMQVVVSYRPRTRAVRLLVRKPKPPAIRCTSWSPLDLARKAAPERAAVMSISAWNRLRARFELDHDSWPFNRVNRRSKAWIVDHGPTLRRRSALLNHRHEPSRDRLSHRWMILHLHLPAECPS